MPTPRRWVPAPRHADAMWPRDAAAEASGPRHPPTPASAEPEPDAISPRDMMFCAEFAVHGGVAESSKGFAAEGALLRMRRHGLLELERGADPPFAVTRVTLSKAAWERLSGAARPGSGDDPGRLPLASAPFSSAAPARAATARRDSGPRTARGEAPLLDTRLDTPSLRRGFEVARGLIGAAVKAELLAWRARDAPDATPDLLEQRIMTRISRIAMPFAP